MKNTAMLFSATLLIGLTSCATPPVKRVDGFRAVKIGNLTWMAENLNVEMRDSWCYGGNDSNCVKYGRLYMWDAAVRACPDGWRLPNNADWDDLMGALGGAKTTEPVNGWDSFSTYHGAGKKLKSRSGWSDHQGASGNGTDDYGFSALPGGMRYHDDGSFGCLGGCGEWWSATEYDRGSAYGWHILMLDDGDNKLEGCSEIYSDKGTGSSVRCVRD